ncbi:MAG TPA: thioredoxin [Candidatus Krumholzibacteria bacterium]|nr:thioredoxin [Candidatus Krumholzibacteria bacterium]
MSGSLKVFTDAAFDHEVMQSATPVLVDFWAPWCGPCKKLTPTMEKLADEFAGRMVIGKMDVQDHPQTAGNFGIMSIPALLFVKGGVVVGQLGNASEDKIRQKIEEVLA